MESLGIGNKRARVDAGEATESPEAKRIRDDILGILDDADDRDDAAPDLDSFMRSFEEEIGLPNFASECGEELSVSDSGEPRMDLGYLLEASDDELGLPPSSSGEEKDEEAIGGLLSEESGEVGFAGGWGFEDEIPSYEFGAWAEREVNGLDEEVVFEGLFDYSDGFGLSAAADLSERPWLAESLSAL